MNNEILWRVKRFGNDFHECESLQNGLTRYKNRNLRYRMYDFISYTLFYILDTQYC